MNQICGRDGIFAQASLQGNQFFILWVSHGRGKPGSECRLPSSQLNTAGTNMV